MVISELLEDLLDVLAMVVQVPGVIEDVVNIHDQQSDGGTP